MKFWVAVTDSGWFEHLSRLNPDEANFWQPGGGREFKALQPGEPFLFKLHSPQNFIVGGGFFVRSSALPASLAWEAFERKNGVASFDDLRRRIQKYRPGDASPNPVIGCNIVNAPFFFSRANWIPSPASFSLNIVSGKSYSTETQDGAQLWAQVAESLETSMTAEPAAREQADQPRFGEAYLTRGRLGQGAFRVLVTDAYQRRCAVTGERTLPVLQAAHIKPYSELGPHRVSNGLLLRSDLHTLFDLGYLTVNRELKLEVSSRLKQEWQNGREYYAHHGKSLAFLPDKKASQPAAEFLEWHNNARFRG